MNNPAEKPKLCIDCEHYYNPFGPTARPLYSECMRTRVIVKSPVDGSDVTMEGAKQCAFERSKGGLWSKACGPNAKHFTPKPTP